MLLVAAAQQPVAGVVFVLDGVLIGAAGQDYLALAGLAAAGVFAAGAALVLAEHAGLAALWLVFRLWLLARFVALTAPSRSSQWLVTGAVRGQPAPGSGPHHRHPGPHHAHPEVKGKPDFGKPGPALAYGQLFCGNRIYVS